MARTGSVPTLVWTHEKLQNKTIEEQQDPYFSCISLCVTCYFPQVETSKLLYTVGGIDPNKQRERILANIVKSPERKTSFEHSQLDVHASMDSSPYIHIQIYSAL